MNAPVIVLGFLLASFPVFATPADCTPGTPLETPCQIAIAALHPTQFALGMRKVRARESKLQNRTDSKLETYLDKHVAPLVLGPGGVFYILDRQHLARALEDDGFTVLVGSIQKDLSALSTDDFWKEMEASNFVYLYDENGQGPHDPSELPQNIAQMSDDPYRSLAGAVRDEGGYEKTDIYFADFQWAQYFRNRVQLGEGDDGFEAAINQAVGLAKSPEAKGLPGYIGAQ